MVYLQTRRSSSGKCLNVTSERKATTWRRTADCSRTPAPSILSAFPFCVPWSWWLRRRLGRLTTYESVFIPLSLVVMKSVFCGGNTYLEWRYPMKRGRSVSSRPCLVEGVCHNSVQLSLPFSLGAWPLDFFSLLPRESRPKRVKVCLHWNHRLWKSMQ